MAADGYYRIVVPTDFSECSRAAWDEAQRLARAFGSELVLLHVLVEPAPFSGAPFGLGVGREFYDGIRRWAEGELQRWIEAPKAAGLAVRGEIRTGVAHREIVDLATDTRADLVVIGTHGRSGLDRALLGSVADRVLRLAPCPVLAVRPAG